MKELLTPGGEHHEVGDEGWLMMTMTATCSLRWYFPEEEGMMQHSRDKYFPQL